jgi:uncharacterized protein YwgA
MILEINGTVLSNNTVKEQVTKYIHNKYLCDNQQEIVNMMNKSIDPGTLQICNSILQFVGPYSYQLTSDYNEA